jgi:hypothetical protein
LVEIRHAVTVAHCLQVNHFTSTPWLGC